MGLLNEALAIFGLSPLRSTNDDDLRPRAHAYGIPYPATNGVPLFVIVESYFGSQSGSLICGEHVDPTSRDENAF